MDLNKALEVSNDPNSSEALLTEAYKVAKNTLVGDLTAKKIFVNLSNKALTPQLFDELISSSNDVDVLQELAQNARLSTNTVKALYEKISSLFSGANDEIQEMFAKNLKSKILIHQNLGKSMLNYLAKSDKIISSILEKQPMRKEVFLRFLKEGDETVRKLVCQNVFLPEDVILKIEQTPEIKEGLQIREARSKKLEVSALLNVKTNKPPTKEKKERKQIMSKSDTNADTNEQEDSFFGELKAIAGEAVMVAGASTVNEMATEKIKDFLENTLGIDKKVLESPAINMLLKPALPGLLMLAASSQEDFITEHLGETVFSTLTDLSKAAFEDANTDSMNAVLDAVLPALKELTGSSEFKQLAEAEEHETKMLNGE